MESAKSILKRIAKDLNLLAECFPEEEGKAEAEAVEVKPEAPAIKLEDVRGKLASISRDGYTKEVRDLLKKYNAKKLSEVDPSNYENLLKDAEAIGNAS